ncbi:predicted protein [Nematostella vectensis]|uniref:G-protein coupled receptors family 1 profile domain-containing protein n=1 Tax=Nematostella vectensis TaxID=45351 RepID=A7T333_NEMVE|nr:predicted protein [Nematostella vectensis]|eukprot:XP_001621735.1 predicted protein [Nematostella vectensis]
MASILHLAGVSVERFMAISRPTKYMLLTQKPYKNAIIIMWLLAALIACLFPIQTTFQWSTIFTLMMFSFGFIIPLIIISSMYITIFKISKKVIVPIERRVSSDDLKRQMRKEHQLARTGALVTGLFFVGWLPFFVVSLIGNFCPPCLKPYPGFDLKLTAFVKFMHYVFQPIIHEPLSKSESCGFVSKSSNKDLDSGQNGELVYMDPYTTNNDKNSDESEQVPLSPQTKQKEEIGNDKVTVWYS